MKKEFFIADTHFSHGNIIKYCKRTEFCDITEKNLMELIDKGLIPQNELKISKETIKRHDDALIKNINSVVQSNDVLRIIGDFGFFKTEKDIESILDRINCSNIHLIVGNHDKWLDSPVFSRQVARFKSIKQFDLINCYGQKIFLSHYPCRSWDSSYHESWNLYGHVHANFCEEDDGIFNETKKKKIENVLLKFGVKPESINDLISELGYELLAGRLTLDVGVDNPKNKFFPWSFDQVKNYMIPKIKIFKEKKIFF